jgi:hypothetical protein
LASQSFNFECTWWRWFQKRVIPTKFDIYIFIVFSIKLRSAIKLKYWNFNYAPYLNRGSKYSHWSCFYSFWLHLWYLLFFLIDFSLNLWNPFSSRMLFAILNTKLKEGSTYSHWYCFEASLYKDSSSVIYSIIHILYNWFHNSFNLIEVRFVTN